MIISDHAPSQGLLKQNIVKISDKPGFIAVSFDTESDSVIFLPNSGDVLLSPRASLDSLFEKKPTDAYESMALESVLKHLGIEIR